MLSRGSQKSTRPPTNFRDEQMGNCASAATGRYPVSVHVYTLVDGEEEPLFGLMGAAFGVEGIYLATVKVGGKEYIFDGGDRTPQPAAPQSADGVAPPPAAAAPRKGGIRSYKARRVRAGSKPPADVHGADSVRGLKGELPMGVSALSPKALQAALTELSATYNADSYNLRTCNPNHFADALCHKLVGAGLPEWVNRAAVRAPRRRRRRARARAWRAPLTARHAQSSACLAARPLRPRPRRPWAGRWALTWRAWSRSSRR